MGTYFSIFFFIVTLFYIIIIFTSQFVLVKDLKMRIEKDKDDKNKVEIYEDSIKVINLICLILLIGYIGGILLFFIMI